MAPLPPTPATPATPGKTPTNSPDATPPAPADQQPQPPPEGQGPAPARDTPTAADAVPPPSTPGDQGKAGRGIPPDAAALIASVVRSGGNSTAALLDALRALEAFGLSPEEAVLVGMGHFPVAGPAAFSDDWLMPRYTPVFHLHQGNDIFAATGTPLRAPFEGTVRYGDEPVGGLAAYVTTADGTYFYMAHMDAAAAGLASGTHVAQGQVVGFVGDSGNARGGSPHCHFEIHPGGGPAVDPKAFLDSWLTEAIAAVPQLLAAYVSSEPRVLVSAGLVRQFDVGNSFAPTSQASTPLLWASSLSPAGGVLGLAETRAARSADGLDWEAMAARAQADVVVWKQASDGARALLVPLDPPALSRLLGATGPSPGEP